MAYSMYFWREVGAVSIPPDEVCNKLCQEREVEGVEALPIDAIKQSFADEFAELKIGILSLIWEGAGSYFEVHWPADVTNILIVSCGFKLLNSPATMNRIIDVAAKYGCAVYDPQTGKRYPQPQIEK